MCRMDWERSWSQRGGVGEQGGAGRAGQFCQEVLQELGVPRRLKLLGAQEEMLGVMEVWDRAEGGTECCRGLLVLEKGRLGSAKD